MFNSHDLMQCRAQDFTSYDPVSLVDLRDITIDTEKPVTQRVQDFIEQVKNPYIFKVGDITVKVNYGEGKQLSDALVNLFKAG